MLITTNPNSSRRPNKTIIQNFKNLKLFEPSKCNKNDEIKTKEDKRKKKKEEFFESCLLFSFLLFCWVLIIVNFFIF